MKFSKWELAHMDVAHRYAKLSTARRLNVGSIIVKNNRVISIGYNGTPAGWDNDCEKKVYGGDWLNDDETRSRALFEFSYPLADEVGRYKLVTKEEVLHAEENAILKLAGSSEDGTGAEMFNTHSCCIHCAKLIHGAKIKRFYYKTLYRDATGLDFLNKCGIDVIAM